MRVLLAVIETIAIFAMAIFLTWIGTQGTLGIIMLFIILFIMIFISESN